jgi:lysozyme
MQISPNGLKFLMEAEGCKLRTYLDSAGLPTIGVGHLIRTGEDFSRGIDTKGAIDLLHKDLERFEAAVNNLVTVALLQSQYDALVAFAFNVGVGSFKTSTLLKELNVGNYDAIPEQLLRWTKAGGRQIAGLVNRRKAEIELWETVTV